MANDVEIRVTVRDNSDRGLDAARRKARESGDHIARELSRAGEKAGEGFERGLASKLTKGGGEGRGFFGRMFDGLADQAANAADAVGKSLAQIPVAISGLASSTVATGGINLLIGALVALVAAAAAAAIGLVALAPAVYLVGGAFGATATAGVGLASVLGTLLVGLGGIGDAWSAFGQKSGGGGRSAADAAHGVRMATLALADAQRSAVQAQEAVTRARMDEQERLEDLSRSLAGARLDEEGAVLAVAQAEQRLRDVRRNRGSALDYREAELALRKAKQTLEEVQDRVGDLSQEQQEANRKGVEGSDAVQDALERQRQAQRQIEQATYALAQAQRGAGGGVDRFAEAMAALSPNARAFMETLFRLREQFAGIKRETQDRLFEGLDKAVERLATRSFPTLRTILTETAASLNGVVKGALNALGQKTFLDNITTATRGFNGWLDRLGATTVPKLIDAIGRLAAKSVPFFEEVGDLISDIFEDFSDWIAEADKTGKLDTFFKDAAANLRTLRDIGGTALDIIGQIVGILFPASKRESGDWMEGIAARLHQLSDWLKDEENQKKIQDWITDLQDFRDGAVETATKIGNIVDKVDAWVSKLDGFAKNFAKLKGAMKAAAKGLWDPISEGFKSALNWIIDKWNNLSFTLPGFSAFGQQIGGGTLDTPNIQRFDHGGITGGLVSVAERSREAISTPGGGMLLALPQGSTVHPNGATERMLGGGGASQIILGFEERAGNDLEALLIKLIKRYIKVNGGKGQDSVQRALGWN